MKNRKRNRLQGYDYSLDNLYFVTSCVQDRVCCFGHVANGEMILNEYGTIAHQQFIWLNNQYDYVDVPVFVVMPNHVHAIIEIDRTFVGTGRDLSCLIPFADSDGSRPVPTESNPYTDADGSRPVPTIKSLSQLMGAYKTTVSKQIHLTGFVEFQWQRSFHDHIIGNEKSYHTISNYIENNPVKWGDDKFFK